MSRAELQKIADLVQRRNLMVITDEIYSELTFEASTSASLHCRE